MSAYRRGWLARYWAMVQSLAVLQEMWTGSQARLWIALAVLQHLRDCWQTPRLRRALRQPAHAFSSPHTHAGADSVAV